MITADDVRQHLAEAKVSGDWTDDRVSAVLAAEHAAQRSVLDLPSPRPAEADQALLLRVTHNLTTSTSKSVERIGAHGDGVRDLERPWSRRRARADQDAETPKPRRKRAAKKTAAKKAATSQKEPS